ncbi:hypothetical protein [Bradyrhizobium iriomotense]|uniref:Uncharacterized protein n=1 Tax=Bradyrhizobium iriomotense TaxID=441950 RepID=A0ABQ6BDH8_9BRAD|nr:hypothetical protein [Bradyrhizobium iriomotense]GLR90970.1 hypothetical protein GCM10007857_76860 [Bradyrhizobium iriomotense]
MRELGVARDDRALVPVADLANRLSEAGMFVVSALESSSEAAMKIHFI